MNVLAATLHCDIMINEILADPPGSAAGDLQGDANHDGVRSSSDDEFVELANSTTHDIDMSGYQLLFSHFKHDHVHSATHVCRKGNVLPGVLGLSCGLWRWETRSGVIRALATHKWSKLRRKTGADELGVRDNGAR